MGSKNSAQNAHAFGDMRFMLTRCICMRNNIV